MTQYCSTYFSIRVYQKYLSIKTINDTKGHAFGDKILKETASRLSRSIRSSDTVARIGGDVFIVILENTSDKNDLSSEPFRIDVKVSYIGCSVGIATFPENGTTIDALLLYADKGIYKSKRKERGTYHF